jgi:ATP-binding cassette, subfamily B, bacterial
MRKSNRDGYFKILLRTIGLIYKAAPFDLSISIVIAFISGFGPALSLLLTKYIVDDLSKLSSSPFSLISSQESIKIYSFLGLMLAITIGADALSRSGNLLAPNVEDKVQGYAKHSLMNKVSEFKDISIFESPEILNLLKLAEKGLRNFADSIYLLLNVISGLFIFTASVFVSITIAWWIPLLILLTSIPLLILEPRYRLLSWTVEETQAESIRQLDIYSNLLLSDTFAKEVRVLSLQSMILEKWIELYKSTYQKMYRLRFKGGFFTFVSSCFEGLGLIIPYVVLVSGVINRSYTIGDLVLFSGLVLQVRGGLHLSGGSLNHLFSNLLSTRPVFQFLDLKSTFSHADHSYSLNEIHENNGKLDIKNMSFSYPGSTQLVLKNITLQVLPKQMVVIVGENGSGKSTLAKLLCRFYDPQSGEILWNGQDIRSLSIDSLRAKIAVVFQDFARFPASVRENIGWANLEKINDNESVKKLLLKVKLFQFFKQHHDGLDTLLTKLFDGGTDLSGGQWQRIAIARAMARIDQTELLILDEPTASIDPENEHEVYGLIREMASNCTTIVISHRLGMARFADRVVVLNNGSIIEEGSHEELMFQAGKYSDMFNKQMSQYV